MKKLMILGILFLLLMTAACQDTPAIQPEVKEPAATVSSQAETPSSSMANPESPLPVEELLLQNYVQIYETYCGLEFTGIPSEIMMQRYLLGWLLENNQIDRYAVYNGSKIDYYALPRQDAVAFSKLFFNEELTESSDYPKYWRFDTAVAEPPEIAVVATLESFEQLENGNCKLIIQRTMNGRSWYPAEYEFALATVESTIPSMLTGKTTAGAAVYQFVSMRNLPLPGEKTGEMISIRTPEDLVELSRQVNSGDWSYQSNVYQLMADLDMSGISFDPIGGYASGDQRDPAPTGFCTTFDGRGNTIRNLTVQSHVGLTGLFGMLGANGFVTNLKLEDCQIASDTSQYKAGGGYSTGGIAGEVIGGAVSRCTVTGTISGSRNVGGIVGLTDNNANVQESTADVRVTGNQRVGGVAGYTEESRLTGCTVIGTVNGIAIGETAPASIGGFTGTNNKSTIDRGIVSVDVTSETSGIAGSFTGGGTGKLIGCFYSTDVSTEIPPVPGMEQILPNELIGMTRQELEDLGAFQNMHNRK